MRRAFLAFALLLAGIAQAFAAVALDATGTSAAVLTATSTTFTGITVGSGSNRALVVVIASDIAITSVTATWDSGGSNQAMTQIVTATNTGETALIFGLVNPVAGNKTLALSWTSTADIYVDAISFTGVDQTGGGTTFVSDGSGTPSGGHIIITPSAGANDASVASIAGANGNHSTATTATRLYSNSSGNGNGYASYRIGAGSIDETVDGALLVMVAATIKATSGAAPQASPLSVLGAGR